VIFYAIYKIQQFNLTIGVHILRIGPWKESGLCNVAPMAVAGAGGSIPARPAAPWPGEGVEEGLGTT
jgi:hypothetical protein